MVTPIVSEHIVRASSTLTSSYVAGTVFSIDTHNTIGIIVDYTNGDEDSMEVLVEVADSTGFAGEITESASGGTITGTAAHRTFAATGTYTFNIHPVAGKKVRISVKSTGGTPTGTCSVRAVASYT